jgi:hypothetical protein
MPTINQLPLLAQVSPGDQLPVYTPNNGDARRLPVSQLLTYFQQSFASPTMAVNLYVPGNGFSIAVPTPVSEQQWVILQPAGPLAAGTVTLPLNTGVPDGTEILITTTQNITALTIGINGAAAIFGNVTTLAGGSAVRYRFYQATNSWYAITTDPNSTLSGPMQTFLSNPTSANFAAAISGETGTGAVVFNDTPTLISPLLGTPTSGTLTNCTGLPIAAGTTGTLPVARGGTGTTASTGTGNLVLDTSPTLVTPVLGTPISGTLTNCTSLPLTTGITGVLPEANGGTGLAALGAGVITFLGTPTSANLAAAVTDETGTGDLVFSDSPTLVTPNIGAATATSLATGPVFGTSQALSGPGAVDITTYTTAFTSTGTGDALTLADGTNGQIKNIVYVAQTAGADTGILTPTNLGAFTTITFNDPGDSVQLQFLGTQWWVISAFNAVVA